MSINRSDKMATWPIGKLLYSMSIPAVISMLIQALYNIVDTMYVSQLGTQTLFAIGLVYPLQMIVISVALGGAVGASTLVARRLGEKNHQEASKTASTGMILVGIHYLIMILVGLFLSRPFLQLFTSDQMVLDLGYQYLSIVMCVSFGCLFGVYFERILQSTGNMIMPMISQLIGAIINIVLDPILIFGYFGLPAMGIQGAALATVIGQIIAMTFAGCVVFLGNHEVNFTLKGLHMRKERIKAIYEVGLPVMIMNAIGSFTTTLLNFVLVGFGSEAVTALTIYFKVQSFVFMPCFGFNQGSLPILSYNFGAKNFERYKKTVKLYALTCVSIMVLGTLLFMFGTDLLWQLFNPTPELLAVGEPAFRIISLSFVIAAVTICMITVFQSIGMGFSSMMVSVLRQIGFLVPLAFIFGKIWGVTGVWVAYPVAELLVVAIYLAPCIKAVKRQFNAI